MSVLIIGLLSIYGVGDGYSGKRLANGEKFTEEQKHIAHRTLRIGTKVKLTLKRTGRSVIAVVRDRGPYGWCHWTGKGTPELPPLTKRAGHFVRRGKAWKWIACAPGYKWQRRTIKPQTHGYYRAEVDVTWLVARALGAKGIERVKIETTARPIGVSMLAPTRQ